MIHFKYTDLEPNLGGMNKIKDIYGPNGPSQGNIVTFFAEFDTHYPEITGLENVTNKVRFHQIRQATKLQLHTQLISLQETQA